MHVCIWHCEHAMFCVEILMYNVSLTESLSIIIINIIIIVVVVMPV